MKKMLFFVSVIACITCIAGCNKNVPEKITGEVRGFNTKILSDSVSVTIFSVDTEEDEKKRKTMEITVDLKDSLNKKVVAEMLSMSMYNYYQPVFARFEKQENLDYKCVEIAVMNYDIVGTPPVFIFQSDNYIVSN